MYFFSFIYNMLKYQKEEKGFCKTQKYELQLLPAACCFHKNELEIFEDWPRRPPPSPDASGLPPFPATLPQTSTSPISHFFFFLSSTIFLFFFFSFFFLPFSFSFFFFSLFLVYTFFFLAFFYPLFCFLFPTLFFLSLFFYFYHPARFLCAPSQRLQNRT